MNILRRPRRGRGIRGLAVVGVMAAAVAVCATAAAATLPTTVIGSGSDVTFHVATALDTLYNQSPGCNVIAPSGTQPLDQSCVADPNNPDVTTEDVNHDVVSENYPIGGGAGVNQVCSQGLANVAHVDYARQTSPYSSTNCTGLNFVAYARDAVTFEAFPGVAGSAAANLNNNSGACNGVNGLCLTTAQLQGIFVNCTITNWNQIGGANAPIKIYTILPQYGTSKFWYTSLGGGSSTSCGATAIHQTNNSEIAAGDLANAIMPVSVGSWTERYKAKPAGSALGSVDGVAPTATTIQNGSFPFGRFIYNVYCAGDPTKGNLCGSTSAASAAVVRFTGPKNSWLCRTGAHAKDPITGTGYHNEIVAAIKKYGFVSLPSGAIGGGVTGNSYCRLTTHS
jgi:hypothetical protein